jgi:hypothetical protein
MSQRCVCIGESDLHSQRAMTQFLDFLGEWNHLRVKPRILKLIFILFAATWGNEVGTWITQTEATQNGKLEDRSYALENLALWKSEKRVTCGNGIIVVLYWCPHCPWISQRIRTSLPGSSKSHLLIYNHVTPAIALIRIIYFHLLQRQS